MRLDGSLPAVPRAVLALLVAVSALVSGCSSSRLAQPQTEPLSSISLDVHADTLAVLGERLFVATAYDTNGVVTGKVSLSWTSTDPAVCTVETSGLATAVGEGSALIIASASGKSDTARVYVKSAATGWYVQASGTSRKLNGVYFLADGHTGFAVGDLGTMVTTSDAGATWRPRASGTSVELTSVWFSDASTGWATGAGGTLLRTIDAGASWVRQLNLPTTAMLECVRFVDANHGWVVGGGVAGFVARTTDGGATWTAQPLAGSSLYGVAFSDTLNGWASGAGVLYGTHDGGVSWYLVQPSVTAELLRGVARVGDTPVGEAQAWAVGSQGGIATAASTADSVSWSLFPAGANYQLNAIHMVSPQKGWIAGSNLAAGAILETIDGGASWTAQSSASDVRLNGIFFTDALRGWAVGAAGRIVHTSTGGAP